MMITAPPYFSKCSPLAAVHFTDNTVPGRVVNVISVLSAKRPPMHTLDWADNNFHESLFLMKYGISYEKKGPHTSNVEKVFTETKLFKILHLTTA